MKVERKCTVRVTNSLSKKINDGKEKSNPDFMQGFPCNS